MQSEAIRRSFLEFFEGKGHHIVESSSLQPTAPNLLFTNAGMNPFVPYFLGERKAQFKRIADTQKCIRAGGKHNDLEEVGFDTYHHTFFEMLGNWSLGDYFKNEAIHWAWELLTKVWEFPKNRLYATVYKPSDRDPAEFDMEAYQIWQEIFRAENLDPDVHVLTGGKKDNFWMMGDTGPCGPCSEIHMDLTPHGDSQGKLVNQGDARCMEIWNLVFMQYNALPNGEFKLLKDKFVDTGMGFERIAGILSTTHHFTDFSHVPSNYDSDLFSPIFQQLEAESNHRYGGRVPVSGRSQLDPETLADCAFRILADHARTLTFAIADGILPGNEGRNYVLRRILRRAVLFGQRLNLKEGFMARLVQTVADKMGDFFKELPRQIEVIKKVVEAEERAFTSTLQKGLHLFERWTEENCKALTGEQAFLLYDTYGFPIDLTQLIAEERNISVNLEGFKQHMELQKERSRSAAKKSIVTVQDENSKTIKTLFVGYELAHCTAYSSLLLDVLQDGKKVYFVTEATPFYAECGGQIGDTGLIQFEDGFETHILDTKNQNGLILHQVDSDYASLTPRKGQRVRLSVDLERRKLISIHHTATHLLHWALRSLLGEHVHQAGSWVQAHQLRFDFSHFEKISPDQLRQLEALCCEQILANKEIKTIEMAFEDRPKDCLAFFEDKYGDRVRVVHLGDFSKELCGGTHAQRTGDLGFFQIKQEMAVAAGIRRIEAVVGLPALRYVQEQLEPLHALETSLACKTDQLLSRFQSLQQKNNELEKQYRQSLQKNTANYVAEEITGRNDLKCARWNLQTMDMGTLRSVSKSYFSDHKLDILFSFGENNEKASVLVFCSENAIKSGFSASNLIKKLLAPLGASGGGKPDFASGGVKDVESLKIYLKAFSLKTWLEGN